MHGHSKLRGRQAHHKDVMPMLTADPATLSHHTVASPTSDLPISGANAAAAAVIQSARKRPLTSPTGYDEITSPTKRRRLEISGQESTEFHGSADSDGLPTAESDGTSHSRFRYFGALASTSENNDNFSESSISPTSPWAPPEQSSNVRASVTAPSRLPPRATVSSPMAKPESFRPTEKMPVDGTPADRMPARHDWGLRGKLMRESSFATFRPDECRSRDSSDKYNGPRLGDNERTPKGTKERSVGDDDLGLDVQTSCDHLPSTANTEEAADPDQAEAEAEARSHNVITAEQIRIEAQSLAETLEQEGKEIWTGNQPSIVMSPGICTPRDLRILATDGRLNDELLNTVPVLGDCEDVCGYLLPTFVMPLVRQARYKDSDNWTTKIPKQAKRWVFGVHESDHWMAIRVDWTERLIQHYDPLHQSTTARSRLTLQHVERWAIHQCGGGSVWRLENFAGPLQAKDDYVNCGVYVTWVLRHWIRGDDGGAASLVSPLAFKMEILRLLRMSLTTSVLPPVGEDDARSDSTCSDDHAAVPGHKCRSGISPEWTSAGQTSENNAAARDGQCYKEMPPATSQHIKDTTLAAPADSPLGTNVTPPPGHAYIDHDQIQHVTEPAP
ncbi:hypothetical protein LTR01_009193, partial [Friedmanniomyces endolithicus]